jgi:tetratricopeptide (TPR) repeat protein
MRVFVALAGVVSLVSVLQASDLPSQDQTLQAANRRHELGDYAGTERLLRGGIADASMTTEERAKLMANLIDLLHEQDRITEALAVYDEAMKLSGLAPTEQAVFLIERAELACDLHEWDEGVALWRQVGDLAAAAHSNALEAAYTGGLGQTYYWMGNLTRAEPLARRSLALLEEDTHAAPPQIATAFALMASVYTSEDKLTLAEDNLEQAIEKDEVVFGPTHPQVAMLLEQKAGLQSRRGDAPAARATLGRAREIMTDHFGPDSMAVAAICTLQGEVEQRDHRPAAAVAQYRSALEMVRSAGIAGARFSTTIITRYAAALRAMHQPAAAKALLAQ